MMLVPLAFGLLLFGPFSGTAALWLYLVLCGFRPASPTRPFRHVGELYGLAHLGAIRAMATATYSVLPLDR